MYRIENQKANISERSIVRAINPVSRRFCFAVRDRRIPCALEDRGEEEEEKEGEAKRATVIGRAGWRALGFSRNRVARGGPEKRMDEWEKEKEAERLERWLPLAVLVWNKGSSKGTRPRCNDFAHARNSIL